MRKRQNSKYLIIDIGNSNIACAESLNNKAVNRKIINKKRIKTDCFQKIFEYYDVSAYKKVIISSVVPKIDSFLKRFKNIVFINHKTVPLITLNLEKPNQVGADRLVNALAAWQLYKRSCLIIDSGTAITFCHIDVQGCYQGGTIFPGMKIASTALNKYTAKIPLIHVKPVTQICGKSTKSSVQSGLYYGYLALINGLIEIYKNKYPGIYIVGTGKGLEIFKNDLLLDVFNDDLILDGLNLCTKYF